MKDYLNVEKSSALEQFYFKSTFMSLFMYQHKSTKIFRHLREHRYSHQTVHECQRYEDDKECMRYCADVL